MRGIERFSGMGMVKGGWADGEIREDVQPIANQLGAAGFKNQAIGPRGYQKDKKKGPYLSNTQGRGLSKKNPAATDSPTGLPLQYHRRWRT